MNIEALTSPILTRENYFDVNFHPEDGLPIISASALKHIYPGEGGSQKRLALYLEGKMKEEETKGMSLGTIFHRYMENSKDFMVSPVNMPEPGVQKVVDHVFTALTDPQFKAIRAWELIGTQLIASAREIGYQPKWGNDAVLKKISADGRDYFGFLCEASGHQILTASQKEKFDGMQQSIQDSKFAELIFSKRALHEVPVLWKEGGVWCKTLIDWLLLPGEGNATIIDFKTTSYPIGTFYYREKFVDGVVSMVGSTYYDFKYFRQLAFQVKAIESQMLRASVLPHVLAIETEPPYECELREADAILRGNGEIDICLREVASYQQNLKRI